MLWCNVGQTIVFVVCQPSVRNGRLTDDRRRSSVHHGSQLRHGELEDARHEAALMEYVTSANIACGGQPATRPPWSATARLAIAAACASGRIPAIPTRQFRAHCDRHARRRNRGNVRRQIERLDAVVAQPGRPHRSREAPRRVVQRGPCGIRKWRGPSPAGWRRGTRALRSSAWQAPPCWTCGAKMGLAGRGPRRYADRRYEPDGTLRPRQFADASSTYPARGRPASLHFAREGNVRPSACMAIPPAPWILKRAARRYYSSNEAVLIFGRCRSAVRGRISAPARSRLRQRSRSTIPASSSSSNQVWVYADDACTWTYSTDSPSWITLTSAFPKGIGSGVGAFYWSAAANIAPPCAKPRSA